MNDDAGKLVNRKLFLETYGGSFSSKGRYAEWISEPDYSHHTDKYVVKHQITI